MLPLEATWVGLEVMLCERSETQRDRCAAEYMFCFVGRFEHQPELTERIPNVWGARKAGGCGSWMTATQTELEGSSKFQFLTMMHRCCMEDWVAGQQLVGSK